MALNVQGSTNLFWKAGIDTNGLRRDASTVQSIMKTVGTFITGYMVRDVMKAALTQDRALTKVAAAYKQLGIYSGDLMRDTIKLGNAMQDIANVEDNIVEENIALMVTIGKLRADQIEPATKAAIGLSKAYGLDLASAFNLVGRAAVGQTQTLARYGIVLREDATEQEKFNELLKKGAEGFETAKIQAGDATGSYEKLNNAIGDLKESFGAFAANEKVVFFIDMVSYGIKNLTDYLNNLGIVWDIVSLKMQSKWLDIAHVIKSAGISQAPGLSNEQRLAAMKKETESYEQNLIQLEKYYSNRIIAREKQATSKYDKVPGTGAMATPVSSVAEDIAEAKERNTKYADEEMKYFAEREKRIAKQQENEKKAFVQSEEFMQDFAVQMALITEQEIADNKEAADKASLDKMIKNTRGWNAKQYLEYAKFLQNKAKLYADDEAMRMRLLDEATEAINKSYELELKKIQEIGDALQSLGNLVGLFDSKLGSSISQVAELTTATTSMMNATTAMGEIGGIVNIAVSVDKWADKLSKFLVKVQDTTRGKDEFSQYWEGWDTFTVAQKEFQISINEGAKKVELIQSLITYMQQKLSDNWSKLTGLERIQMSADIQAQRDRLNEYLTGTTADSIADGIVDGFSQGLDSAAVFADSFEDIMKTAIMNAFKAQIVTEQLKGFYDQFAELAVGGLTKDEIALLRIQYESAVTKIGDIYKGMGELGIDLSGGTATAATTRTGLAGEISGVTEQTAGLLAGTMNAMLMNIVQVKDTLSGLKENELSWIVNASREVRDNTYWNDEIWKELANMNDGKLLPMANAAIETRNMAYYLDDIYYVNSAMKDSLSVIMSTALDNLKASQETAVNTRYLKSIDAKLTVRYPGASMVVSDIPRAIGA